MMTKKQKKNLIRIIVSSVLMVVLLFVPVEGMIRFLLFLIPYLVIGYDILIKAGKGVINLQPFDECFLMALATVGAMVIAVTTDGDYIEAIAVMLFYQIGEWFQSYAVGKSRKSITELMDIRPDYANIEEDGKIVKVDPDEVEIGTVIVVQPGEKIPIDGVVVSGSSLLDTAALTGESIPREVGEGDEVISGCINSSGLIHIKTTKEFEESTVSKILDLVENASSKKSHSEAFITKFARVYTPAVVFGAIALAVLPPLFSMIVLSSSANWTDWIYRALTFLVISCPCALVISIPLSFFAGIGCASWEGILIKGSNYLEILSDTKTVVFDKTGTLTKGVFEVSKIETNGMSEKELLIIAAAAEQYSSHPIALSIVKAAGDDELPRTENVKETAGHGVQAEINGDTILAGNAKLMRSAGVEIPKYSGSGAVVYVARNSTYSGRIIISDIVKPSSAKAIENLRSSGVDKVVMLTGDHDASARSVADELGIDEVYSELLPSDKVAKTEELLGECKSGETLAFVGDGINDAPVLSRADIGIAMGAMGSDAAIEAADVVLMDDDPVKISKAIRISRKCLRIVKENIWFSIGVKLVCLALGAIGIANMWMAIFADVGVMVLAVLNAIRCMKY